MTAKMTGAVLRSLGKLGRPSTKCILNSNMVSPGCTVLQNRWDVTFLINAIIIKLVNDIQISRSGIQKKYCHITATSISKLENEFTFSPYNSVLFFRSDLTAHPTSRSKFLMLCQTWLLYSCCNVKQLESLAACYCSYLANRLATWASSTVEFKSAI